MTHEVIEEKQIRLHGIMGKGHCSHVDMSGHFCKSRYFKLKNLILWIETVRQNVAWDQRQSKSRRSVTQDAPFITVRRPPNERK